MKKRRLTARVHSDFSEHMYAASSKRTSGKRGCEFHTARNEIFWMLYSSLGGCNLRGVVNSDATKAGIGHETACIHTSPPGSNSPPKKTSPKTPSNANTSQPLLIRGQRPNPSSLISPPTHPCVAGNPHAAARSHQSYMRPSDMSQRRPAAKAGAACTARRA
jgi:hypothetical protein